MEAFFNKMQKVGFAMLGGGFLLTRFFFVVDGGQRVLVYDKMRGLQAKEYGEGMHFYVPGLQVRKNKQSIPQTNKILNIGA